MNPFRNESRMQGAPLAPRGIVKWVRCPTHPYAALVRRFTRGQRGQGTTVVEDRPRPLRGIRFDLTEQGGRLRQLAPLVRGFRAPEGFHLWNGEYESVDAEVLWAMVGGLRPHRAMV